jgi:hypothetical protein
MGDDQALYQQANGNIPECKKFPVITRHATATYYRKSVLARPRWLTMTDESHSISLPGMLKILTSKSRTATISRVALFLSSNARKISSGASGPRLENLRISSSLPGGGHRRLISFRSLFKAESFRISRCQVIQIRQRP